MGNAGLTGEEMRNMVNQCFTEVIDIIQAQGGDVMKFAGDALFAVWPVREPAAAAAAPAAAEDGDGDGEDDGHMFGEADGGGEATATG